MKTHQAVTEKSQELLSSITLRRIQGAVNRALTNPRFRSHLDISSGEEIRSIEDLEKLPFMTKSFLRRENPFELCCISPEEVVRIHSTSGTTGDPVIVPYSAEDVATFTRIMARSLRMAGVQPNNRVLITPGYGLWTAGVGFQAGVESIGACAVPTGPIPLEAQFRIIRRMKPDVVIGTASFALLLGETLEKEEKPLHLQGAILGAEQWGEQRRRIIENHLGAPTYDIYGMTETYGPGIAIECSLQEGLHYWNDLFHFEIIRTETGKPAAPGELGEVVITTLCKEALPLIRYRTGDLARLIPEPCPCGSPFPRISRIAGRVDDMITFRGVNVFPGAVEKVLASVPGMGSEFRILLETRNGRDYMILQAELAPQAEGASPEQELRRHLKTFLSISPAIDLVPHGSLERSMKKTPRVFDGRAM